MLIFLPIISNKKKSKQTSLRTWLTSSYSKPNILILFSAHNQKFLLLSSKNQLQENLRVASKTDSTYSIQLGSKIEGLNLPTAKRTRIKIFFMLIFPKKNNKFNSKQTS